MENEEIKTRAGEQTDTTDPPGVKIRPRAGTSSEWETKNPVLAKREIGFEYENAPGDGNLKMKMGNGLNRWTDLPYALGGTSSDGGGQDVEMVKKTTQYLLNLVTLSCFNRGVIHLFILMILLFPKDFDRYIITPIVRF